MSNENKTVVHRQIQDFRASDLALVSFLRYNGLKTKEVVKVNDRRAEFIFEAVDKQLIDDFNADKTSVEPKMFAAIMRQQHRAAKRVISEG